MGALLTHARNPNQAGQTEYGESSTHLALTRRSRTKWPKAVDLFAGAGGFSLGALLAEFDVVAAVEIDKHACTTFSRNLIDNGVSDIRLFHADILDLTPKTLMASANLEAGDCHLLLGGPPCQGFSTHRLKDSGVDDPRNRLLLHYFRFVEALRPRYFLVENVPGLLWPRHKQYLERFLTLAAQAGYEVHCSILNARDYGVPQNRKRVFLFGADQNGARYVPWPPSPTHVSPDSPDIHLGGRMPWIPASSVFARPVSQDDPNDLHMNHKPELIQAFEATPLNGGSRWQSGRTLDCHQQHDGHYDVYGRIDSRRPGPTMTTACINPSKGRFVHPTQPHGITLRQAARFQTFPDWYVFCGGLMAGGCQVGNAVPVKMAKILLRHIRSSSVG